MNSFAVIGLGRFGSNLAKHLTELGGEVLAVDEDMEIVDAISDSVSQAVCGDCTDERVLRSLGIENFDCVIVSMANNIESSILITSLVKSMGVGHVVAKSSSNLHGRVLRQVGADTVVFPERDMAEKVAQNLRVSNILDFIELSDEYAIAEIKLPESWVGKSLIELDVRRKYGINVVAVKNIKTDIIQVTLNPNTPFKEDDVIVVIGSNDDVQKLTK